MKLAADRNEYRPRFFPFGSGPVNEQGVKHYDDVIATIIAAGIKPVVTLFHWGRYTL